MTELLTIAQMRAVEEAAFASGEVESLALMECAGRETTQAILEEWPDLALRPHHAVILCGPGNNGGDGYVIARRLAERGWHVEVLALGDPARLPPDARTNHDLWAGLGAVTPISVAAAEAGERPDVLVDALFGIGIARPLSTELCEARDAVGMRQTTRPGRALRTRKVAVDCSSGLHGDTGRVLLPAAPGRDEGEAEWTAWQHDAMKRIWDADLTVTCHAPKVGHYLEQGPLVSGRLVVRDIGIGRWDEAETALAARPSRHRVRLVGPVLHGREMPGRVWPGRLVRPQGAGAHKYDRGHALILAGGCGKGGAGRLAARAALRSGAGLVTLGCPPGALQENAAQLTAIMLRPVADAAALAGILEDDRISALCLGPGLGVGPATRDLVATVLATGRPTVLDADALTSHRDEPEALFARLHDRAVLTPHEGEFARLFPDLGSRGREGSRIDATRAAAERAGCTVLLKGPDTVIASPGGAASVQAAAYGREAPWLGTAGAGDVLAGLIAGLAARPAGGDVHLAAEAAAWLHVEAARRFGPGLIAEDIPEELPGVFRDLGL